MIISFTLVLLFSIIENSYQDPFPLPSAHDGSHGGPQNVYHIDTAEIHISEDTKKSKSTSDKKKGKYLEVNSTFKIFAVVGVEKQD